MTSFFIDASEDETDATWFGSSDRLRMSASSRMTCSATIPLCALDRVQCLGNHSGLHVSSILQGAPAFFGVAAGSADDIVSIL